MKGVLKLNILTNADDKLLAAYIRKIEALEDLVSAKNGLINSQKDLLQAKDQRIKILEYCIDRYERILHNVVFH
jgi:hypothetical protein